MNNNLPKKIVKNTFEIIKEASRDAVQSLTGTGDYDMSKDKDKILPPEEKQKIKQNEWQMLAQINAQIEEVRKERTEVKNEEKKEEVVKERKEEKKKNDKFAAIKAMIKANQGSKEGSIRASG